MINETFLTTHSVFDDPLVFQIGSNSLPASVRDQIIRAQTFVRLASRTNLENGTPLIGIGKRVLIVGGGVAGITAAIRAAEAGADTVLIDREAEVMSRQAGVRSRYLAPAHYDWPFEHWAETRYPWDSSARPIPFEPWSVQKAALVTGKWRARLARAIKDRPRNLRFERLRQVQVIPRTQNGVVQVQVQANDPNTGAWVDEPKPREFDLVLLTCGFGAEKTFLVKYAGSNSRTRTAAEGFAFWGDDYLDRPDYNVAGDAQILIAGGGDGALQDYLRVTTRPKTRPWDIIHALKIPPHLMAELRQHEAPAQEAFAQNGPGSDCWVNRWIHKKHIDIIEKFYEVDDPTSRLKQFIRDPLPAKLKLIHWCDHFDNCYPMNRFLVLLIAEHLKRNYPGHMQTIFPGLAADWIECLAPNARHIPAGPKTPDAQADACHGKPHHVTLAEARQCGVFDNPYLLPPEEFNVLVIRYGVSLPSLLLDGAKALGRTGVGPQIRQNVPALDLS